MASDEICEIKCCRKCGETKPLSAFRKWKSACIKCLNEECRNWHKNNLAKARAACRRWYHNNRAHVLDRAHTRYEDDRERKREYNRTYYQCRAEAERLRSSQYAKANSEKVKAAARSRYLRTREKQIAAAKKWRQENLDRAIARHNAWTKEHPEQVRANTRNRKALQRSANGRHTAADIVDIRRSQKDRCAMPFCRKNLRGGGHVDHITPLKLGGENGRKNLQLLCSSCNQRKHAKHPLEFARENGLLV